MSKLEAIAVVQGMPAALPTVSELVTRIRITETVDSIDAMRMLQDAMQRNDPGKRRDGPDEGPETKGKGRDPAGPGDGPADPHPKKGRGPRR